MSDEYNKIIKEIEGKFNDHQEKLADATSLPEIKSLLQKVFENIQTLEKVSIDHTYRMDAVENLLSKIKSHVKYEDKT